MFTPTRPLQSPPSRRRVAPRLFAWASFVAVTLALPAPRALAQAGAANKPTAAALQSSAPAQVRIKDLVNVRGVRENQLLGYGLVVGLQNTGDDQRSRFTIQSVVAMLNRLGVRMELAQVLVSLTMRNVAAVIVTAQLPPFARRGGRLDVTVSSLSSATSLVGGVLLQTPLVGGDNQVYAVAQGPLAVGGFGATGIAGNSAQRNHLTTARVASGAIVEREVAFDFGAEKEFVLALRRPDFTTASRIVKAVNESVGEAAARSSDPGTVAVKMPARFKGDPVGLLSTLESLTVTPDRVARVVIAERTGTVVMGSEVRIATVAVSHGNLNIQISTQWAVSQPQSFGRGQTVAVPQSDVQLKEDKRALAVVPQAVTIGELVRALNALGASSRDLISILQAIRASGALDAELEVL